MRALFIVNDPTLFAADSPSRASMRSYAAAIGELHVLSCAAPDAVALSQGSLHLHPGHVSKFASMFTFPGAARELIRRHAIEVVSAQDVFEHGWVALKAVHGTTARLHAQIHVDLLSPHFARESPFNRARLRFAHGHVLPYVDGLRVVSERVWTSVMARYGQRLRPTVAPVVVPRDLPRAMPLPPHDFSFVCLAAGRLVREKRHRDLLAAFSRVHRRHPKAGLFIAGSGRSRRALEALSRSLGLGGAVVFLGHRDDVRSLMPSAQAFIQTSAYEGYGATFVEAALAGLPMVSTDVGLMGELFKPDEDALICPVGDMESVALGLVRMIEDDRLRRRLARHARAVVEAHLDRLGDIPGRIAADLHRTISRPFA